jgi:dimethylhistidine N-methyltransferase
MPAARVDQHRAINTDDPMSAPRFLQLHRPDDAALAAEAAAGLLQPAAAVSPKFLYDALGSRLFDAITELDEYYPTRTEAGIFAAHGEAIAAAVQAATGPAPILVDVGAGDGSKAARLFARLQPRRYVAVDISVDYLRGALARLGREHPGIEMLGLGLDFSAGLALPAGVADEPALVFYPGSSIGNFAPAAARQLIADMRRSSCGGAVLLGVDLVKATSRLEAAYDDALGVTAAFNLNLLRRLNTLLGADFQLRQWQHVALFDAAQSRIEMHLQARVELQVRWAGGERRFEAGERIHTENSYKWTTAGFAALLAEAGLSAQRHWTDAAGDFAVFVAW